MNEVNSEVKMQAVQNLKLYLRQQLQTLYNIMILLHWNPENTDYPLFPNIGSIGITLYDTITVPRSVFYLVSVIYMELLQRC